MTSPLVQSAIPRKTAAGWRVYLSGWNLDLVLGAQFGALPLVTPTVQTARSLEFILPGTMPVGQYPIRLEGGFGELELRGLTVVDLVGLDNYRPAPYTAAEYASQLLELLPKGPAWARRVGANFWKLFSACGEELARVHEAALHLLDELTPSQTVDSLAEWEEELGLPEGCVESPATDDASRRKEIFRKANSLGGSSAAYFEALAALHGFDIRVEEFYLLASPFKAGHSAAGDALTQGPWLFTWRVVVPIAAANVTEFKAGHSAAGDPLRRWGLEELECFIDRLKPSHTLVVYAYIFGEEIAMIGHDAVRMAGDDGVGMIGRT